MKESEVYPFGKLSIQDDKILVTLPKFYEDRIKESK